jgi:hypothetical protein
LDEFFFVDLADKETLTDIFSIHLEKVQHSIGFSGPEVVQVVVSALY